VSRVHVGDVFVDAGAIWVGDPCYVISSDAEYDKMTWNEFCDKWFVFGSVDHELRNSEKPHVSAVLGFGIGLAIDTAWGDGSYPVYVEYNSDGRPSRVTIEFEGSEDDDE
jgi:hypothetical protein